MKKELTWCAIGDSFTYLNDHLEATGFRVRKGYLDRTIEKLGIPVKLINLGIDGSATTEWLHEKLVQADLYTILLGTNDWYRRHTPIGTENDYKNRRPGTILGNLAVIIGNIRNYSPDAPVIVMNPVERGDFVCITNVLNTADGSYSEVCGQKLCDAAGAVYRIVRGKGIYPVDLHSLSGFTVENAVRFKRLVVEGTIKDLKYPEYIGMPYNPQTDPYPYPEEAAGMTFDGLHPSDLGNEKIASVLSDAVKAVLSSERQLEGIF